MARKRQIKQYEHSGKKRVNNPPVGLVSPETDRDDSKKTYQYDPHLDPQLVWAGKAERTSFEVPTVSLHVHERIDPRTIIEAVRKHNGGNGYQSEHPLFEQPEENPPLRQAIEFYKHQHNWSNRLIAGDSLLVMNSLLEKEGLAGKVQMIYIDPPYGIRYGSNFQPFVNRRDVKDRKDEDLTQEPEMIKAFRDTWELGIHSYLTYLRDRLLLARELLHESGSVFVQISDENLHHVRELMDELFGPDNFISQITIKKTAAQTDQYLSSSCDYVVWYSRCRGLTKYRQLYLEKDENSPQAAQYRWCELEDGARKPLNRLTSLEKKGPKRLWRPDNLTSSHEYSEGKEPVEYLGKKYTPGPRYWTTSPSGFEKLRVAGRLVVAGTTLSYLRYLDDFPCSPLLNVWTDTGTGGYGDTRYYVVQTTQKIIQRCLLMTTDPGDLVFDPTCGSGTTAYVAEQWGRRWITCDTSRVALTLAKQRLMIAVFDYYKLAHPETPHPNPLPEGEGVSGVSSGFLYKTVPHVTLKSIANNPEIKEGMTRKQIDAAIQKYAEQETLYDQPEIDKSRARVSGPFTVEAVPAAVAKPLEDIGLPEAADASIARSGETVRQDEWRDELLKTGIRGRSGQRIEFSRVEPLGGTRWLHADAETKGDKPDRTVLSFGPEHAPLEPRQVELALEEARTLKPSPRLVLFAAFQFDPEAAKDIDETNWPGITLLKVQMNADMLTDDLKKKRSSNESFWLIGQPDVAVRMIRKGDDQGKWEVEVYGFDYFNTRKGTIESGDTSNIAMWLLDTDYDGRSLYPRQVFFPMAADKDGWARLARNLKAEIDDELIEAYRGTVSLPFELGENRRVAVKIVDDRGIESLKVVAVE